VRCPILGEARQAKRLQVARSIVRTRTGWNPTLRKTKGGAHGLSTVGLLNVDRHAHPGVNTALPGGRTWWKLIRACHWSHLRGSGFNKYVGRALRLQALRRRGRVSGQLIEYRNESAPEACDPGESVDFATRVLQCGRLPRSKIQCHQLKGSLRSVQQGIESPRAGDLVGLELRNKELEFGGTVLPSLASTGANIVIEGLVVTGITYADRKW